MKVLLQKGADVNAVQKDKWTAIKYAARFGTIECTLRLLCCGAKMDYFKLLELINDRGNLLRDESTMGATLMSNEERHFMWHVAWFLDQKCPEATFKAYCAIRSFITFHGIFMGLGYHLGDDSVWRRKRQNKQ